MDKQESISILQQIKSIISNNQSWMENAQKAVNESIDMAIQALQTEPCEDTISRQAVDEYISHLLSGYLYDEERERLENFSAWLWDELPSVQPTQKVIRCKDCKYVWKEDGWDNLYCNRVKVSGSFAVEKDGFCAWAKMEESEGNDGSIDLHTRR